MITYAIPGKKANPHPFPGVFERIYRFTEQNSDFLLHNPPFGDTDRYAERLRLLMESPAERERLADNALISVKKFDKEHVMQQWVNLFSYLNKQKES